MDPQPDEGQAQTTHTSSTTRVVTDYRTEVSHYRRPLLGVPWIAGLIVVPALLAGLGGLAGRAGTPAATTPGSSTSTPAVAATSPDAASPSPSAAPSTPTPKAAVFQISQDGKTVTVSGIVPDAASKASIVAALKGAYGTGVTVVDQLKVTAGAPVVDSAAFTSLAGALKGVSGARFDAEGNKVTISGAAATAEAKTAILDAAKAAYPGATITSTGLAVGDPNQPPASCDATKGYVQAVTAETKIQFTTGGSVLTPASQAALTKVADAVKKCPTLKLQVAGNTDSVGSPAANQALSLKRAEAVKAQLVTLGVPAANITTVGNGESKPIASNATAAGQATNRRVDIAVQ